ncbi:MAG: imidazolonepropionase, partial [Candidatus Limivicinus sp.]|nr:imidazolonepropionase [Candidatus Limivicinus sp.]
MNDLLVVNIGVLATPEGVRARSGGDQGAVRVLENAWVLIEGGIISAVGTGTPPPAPGADIVDAEGRLVTPGLVDAHTHL